ncbi:SIMPL domain-containing protein [Marmoricola sp. RAF53]|uniref:SIMPL domain-containing protein n=1 Tax=Marmoricola sp. RAF53 TaxID=3233059 RepID=UPI003F9E2176
MEQYLEVVGRGAATQAPDRLDLHISVTLVATDVGDALTGLADKVVALGTALREAGLADADIRTTGSNLGEEYSGHDAEGRRSAGFRASQDLLIRLGDLDRASEVVSAALAAVGDAFRLGHLAWSLADEVPLVDLAREAAYADAAEKAAKLAALAGARVGGLIRVTEGEGYGGGVPRLMTAKADPSFAAERGESRVEVSLTTRWTLVP